MLVTGCDCIVKAVINLRHCADMRTLTTSLWPSPFTRPPHIAHSPSVRIHSLVPTVPARHPQPGCTSLLLPRHSVVLITTRTDKQRHLLLVCVHSTSTLSHSVSLVVCQHVPRSMLSSATVDLTGQPRKSRSVGLASTN